jgi:predicted Zn-ribbon and HTH transcriptional regulator
VSGDEPAGCKKCGRAVYARHLNADGLCSYCRPEAIERARKAEERAQTAEEAQSA